MSVDDIMVEWADDFVARCGCEILSTASIKDEVMKMGVNRSSIIPSDHCYNRANEDATSFVSKTELFLYLERKKYKCVGSKYKYDGRIFCRPKGYSKDFVWGYYDKEARKKIRSPEASELQEDHAERKISRSQVQTHKKINHASQPKAVAEKAIFPGTGCCSTKRLDFRFLYSIERYLNENKKLYDSPIVKCVEERKNGRRFSFNEHLRAYIHAQLSSLRSWSHLEPHLPEIDEIFCNYDVEEIFHILDSVGHDYFIKRIIDIKCGNLKIDQQMQSLRVNIGVFKELIEKHGSLDGFVTSRPVLEIVSMLSQTGSPYNLRFIGMALASEYIRNVGVDCPKPDMHMRRIFGSMRLGQSLKKDSTAHEVYRIIAGISEKTGYTQARIDNILWSYCAKGYGAVCASEPKCNECVIQEYCRHGDNKH